MEQRLREKHKIPETKVLPDLLHEQNPEWYQSLKEDKWWQKDNLRNYNPLKMSKEDAEKLSVFKKLNGIMLEIGGSETCFPYWDDDFVKLLERGYYREGISRKVRGKDCHCHENVAIIYSKKEEMDDFVICTGFALSEDGMWRAHSWMLHHDITGTGKKKSRILETTKKRVAYFGFELTDDEAETFILCNA